MLKTYTRTPRSRSFINRALMIASPCFSVRKPRPTLKCVGDFGVIRIESDPKVAITLKLDKYDTAALFWQSERFGAQRWVLDVGDLSSVLLAVQLYGSEGLDRVTDFLQREDPLLFLMDEPEDTVQDFSPFPLDQYEF